MSVDLAGRHALITGGSRGIGAAIARELATRGARVTLLGRHEATLRDTAAALPGPVGVVIADVTNSDEVTRAFGALASPPDLLINNAGQADTASIQKTDSVLWGRMLAVNLTGAYHCIQAALPAMLDEGFGRIVNISSTAGLKGYAYCAAYCAAKHGLIGLTRALAIELARSGVTVNAVCPGYTDTDLVRDAVVNIQSKTGRDESGALETLLASNPQRRLIAPGEVAEAVAWLCQSKSSSITGQSIAVAGGEVT